MRIALALGMALSLAFAAGVSAEDGSSAVPMPAAAESRSPMPFDIIRSLQFLQDQVARGNDRAIRVQSLLLQRFGPVFLEADAPAWSDPRNWRAAVLFVLSGGPPEVLEGLLRAGVLPNEDRTLVEGAIAYVRNDTGRARSLLRQVDLGGVEPGLAGHVNLVLGQLLQEEAPQEAVLHLDRARLLAPGSLIEESALRLQVLLVDGLGDHARADRLARQYFDRYARSSYSANFEARFAAIFSERGVSDASLAVQSMTDVIDGLALDRRRTIYLAVARRALVEGRLAFAALAAREALAIGAMSEADTERARLYEAAAELGTLAEAPDILASLRRDLLHAEDAKLLDAALNIVGEIDRPALLSEVSQEPPIFSSPLLERAERALGRPLSPSGTQTQ